MNRKDVHFLNCDDKNCEKVACIQRREHEQKILRLETTIAEIYEVANKHPNLEESQLANVIEQAYLDHCEPANTK